MLPINNTTSAHSRTTEIQAGPATWRPRNLDVDTTVRKMFNNLVKAIEEHTTSTPSTPKNSSVFKSSANVSQTSIESLFVTPENSPPPRKSELRFESAQLGGKSPISTEDRYLHKKMVGNGATLVGVFDGHGGAGIADKASKFFADNFESILIECSYNVYQAFEKTIHQLEEAVIQEQEERNTQNVAQGIEPKTEPGTTAVISYIDPKSSLVYTATVGDSYSFLFKNQKDDSEVIPLSNIRNWKTQKEQDRATEMFKSKMPDFLQMWQRQTNSKQAAKNLRYPFPGSGLNCSRSIGDFQIKSFPEPGYSGVTHKPKITISNFQEGDFFGLFSDGVTDVLSIEEIVEIKATNPENLSQAVAFKAKEKGSKDDITAIFIYT